MPSWATGIYQFVTHPPGWVVPAIYITAIVIVFSAAYRARERGVSKEAREAMVANACILAGCAAATWGSVQFLPLPFVGDVLVGFVAGAVAARLTTPWMQAQVEAAIQNTDSTP